MSFKLSDGLWTEALVAKSDRLLVILAVLFSSGQWVMQYPVFRSGKPCVGLRLCTTSTLLASPVSAQSLLQGPRPAPAGSHISVIDLLLRRPWQGAPQEPTQQTCMQSLEMPCA